jgi:hypothetical protein
VTLNGGRVLLRLDYVRDNAGLRHYYKGQGFREVGRHDFNSNQRRPIICVNPI